MESSPSSSAGEGQRRALMAKLKKLRQENLHLKLRLHAQEQHNSTANRSQVEELKEQFVQMKAEKEDAETNLTVIANEREQEPCSIKSELDDTMKLSSEPLPELAESSEKDERPKKMVVAMASALVKLGTYHQHLEHQNEKLKDQEAALEGQKNVLAVELRKAEKELEMVHQDINMKQRTLRKKKIKRSKPVHCLK